MSALQDYIDRVNYFRKALKQPLLSLSTAADRQTIADRIDGDLSPEILTCDGELSRTEVNRRYKALMSAAKQLKKLDPTVKFYEYDEEIA
jgi:hypothetical protein